MSWGFCTNCGNKLEENHRFCGVCGSPVDPSKESSMSVQSNPMPAPGMIQPDAECDSAPNQEYGTPHADMLYNDDISYDARAMGPEPGTLGTPDMVDRKTLFDDGMLVLTSRDLILYTSDERDELKRIPVRSIHSCGYSGLRRCLVVKRRKNEEVNFQRMLAQKNADLATLKSQKAHHEDLLRQTRVRDERESIKSAISKTEDSYRLLVSEIKYMEANPAASYQQVADIHKEFFKLPKSFSGASGRKARDEYRVWEYAVGRRIRGIPMMKIETIPHDAVVVINDAVFGTTPLTIGKPIIDDAILDGRYSVKILKEGHRHEEFKVETDLGKGQFVWKGTISPRDEADHGLDSHVAQLRMEVGDRSIDLSSYEVEQEAVGRNEDLLLTSDEILVMNKDGKQLLFEMPYGAIIEARYDKGLFRGSKAVKITYNDTHFQNLEFDFWLEGGDGISQSEMRQRSESLAELLNRKRRDSKVLDMPHVVKPPDYYVVTEQDIENNFQRFEPYDFERLVARLFARKGYKTTVTSKGGDFGVDVIAEAGNDKIAIQVKHWKTSVGGPDVHKTLGSMFSCGANRAMVVTSSDFTRQAHEIESGDTPVELWNGNRLRDEFRQHLLESIGKAGKA